jgi:hypothetical protein
VFLFVPRRKDEHGSAKYTSAPVSCSILLKSTNSDSLSSVMVRTVTPRAPTGTLPDFPDPHRQVACRIQHPRLPVHQGQQAAFPIPPRNVFPFNIARPFPRFRIRWPLIYRPGIIPVLTAKELTAATRCWVYVLNPCKLAVIYKSMKKIDKEDALKLVYAVEDTREERLLVVPLPGEWELKRGNGYVRMLLIQGT